MDLNDRVKKLTNFSLKQTDYKRFLQNKCVFLQNLESFGIKESHVLDLDQL